MRVIFSTIFFLISFYLLQGQIIRLELGVTYISHKSINPIPPDIKGKRIANDDFYCSIQYTHKWKNNFSILCNYSRYPVTTFFHFYKENAGGGVGWSGTNVNRFELGLEYNLFKNCNFVFQPSLRLGLQKSSPNGTEIIGSEIPDGIRPDNFELLKTIESFAYSNVQVVPIGGFKIGYAFWGGLELFLDIHQVIGFKKIQELRMSYSYNGAVQPDAISYSDGTGRFWALGLGYRFVKQKRN